MQGGGVKRGAVIILPNLLGVGWGGWQGSPEPDSRLQGAAPLLSDLDPLPKQSPPLPLGTANNL